MKRLNHKSPKEIVDEEMTRTQNFKIEEKNDQGQWEPIK